VNDPDAYCALCGADRSTGVQESGGLLTVPVVTPRGEANIRQVCNSCLSAVLGIVLQLVGLTASSMLATAAIELQAQQRPQE
jgi:hypothetical protein